MAFVYRIPKANNKIKTCTNLHAYTNKIIGENIFAKKCNCQFSFMYCLGAYK